MKRVTQIFLAAFLIDGLLSLATATLPSLAPLQGIVAFSVFLAAGALHIGMAFTRRLPKRILLPATIYVLWCGLANAFPVSLVCGSHTGPILAFVETLLGAGLLLVLARSELPSLSSRSGFSWGNFSAVSVLNCGLAFIFAVLFLLSGISLVEEHTAGYIRIRPEGISLEERWFQRGDGKSVRLVGMVHVAKEQFYEDLRTTLPQKESAIVLLEGVTDDDDLLRQKFDYSNLAEVLGLTSQSDSDFMKKAAKESHDPGLSSADTEKIDEADTGIQYWRADVDFSDFQPSTMECIAAVGSIFSSKSLAEVLQKISDPNSPLNRKDGNLSFMSDVVNLRNEHLIGEMEEALRQTNIVVVPWGAMHMPVLEQQLKDWGFQEVYRVRRLAFSFQKEPSVPVPALPDPT